MLKIIQHQIFRRAQAAMIALLVGFAFIVPANASSSHSSAFPNIHISNFGQMDSHFYRGAQPGEEDYQDLAALGIKTIIDLRDDPKDYAKPAAEAAGLHYVNIPMSDKKRPRDEQIEQFLEVANNSANAPFFVHCAGGRHRTGVMGAVYRITVDGWGYDQVYKEMKDYDYYSRWGHGALKDYVKDYCDRAQAEKLVHTSSSSS